MTKEINAGYEILDRQRVGSTEVVLGHNPRAPEPYVTWKCRHGSDYHFGHYFADKNSAVKDFKTRRKKLCKKYKNEPPW